MGWSSKGAHRFITAVKQRLCDELPTTPTEDLCAYLQAEQHGTTLDISEALPMSRAIMNLTSSADIWLDGR